MRNINSILNGGDGSFGWQDGVDMGIKLFDNIWDKTQNKNNSNNNNNNGNNNYNNGNNNYNPNPIVIREKSDNTLLYVAIGAAALIAVALIMKE